MDIEKAIVRDCERVKRKLIKEAQRRGIYENFGQEEIRELESKYFQYKYSRAYRHIDALEEWAESYTG